MSDPCTHESKLVTRSLSKPYVWVCQACGKRFWPDDEIHAATDDTLTETLDAIAGTMSAVLWDFHERAVAKYGADVMPDPDTVQEDCVHAYNSGAENCRKCGYSPYIGGA